MGKRAQKQNWPHVRLQEVVCHQALLPTVSLQDYFNLKVNETEISHDII